mgnify:CR=1 FL=1
MANSTTNIDGIIPSQANKEATANAFFDAASQAATYGRRASTSSGLTWGYYGGNVVIADGSTSQIANGTLTLTPSSTNYIVAAKADGAVSVSTSDTNWNNTADYWRLYSVVTGPATVTSWTDVRAPAQYQGGGSGGGGGGMTNPMTDENDLIVGGAGGLPTRLPVGAEGQVLTVSSGAVAWANPTSGFANPMTTAGDLIYGGTGGAAQRLAVGTDGQVLKVVAGNPAWASEDAEDVAFDNTASGLAATNAQEAIDELADEKLGIQENVSTLAGTTPEISNAGGVTIWGWTLSGASTPTSGLNDGESCTVFITPGANAIDWQNFNVGDAGAPPLTNGKVTVVVCYRIGGTSFVDFVRQHDA